MMAGDVKEKQEKHFVDDRGLPCIEPETAAVLSISAEYTSNL